VNSHLTKFESDVLGLLLEGDSEVLQALISQIEQSGIERELTGAGFYVHFTVDPKCPRVSAKQFRIGDVTADIAGLKYGAGFVLFVDDGKVMQLEGYSYEEPWPARIENYKLKYVKEPRDLPFDSKNDRTKR